MSYTTSTGPKPLTFSEQLLQLAETIAAMPQEEFDRLWEKAMASVTEEDCRRYARLEKLISAVPARCDADDCFYCRNEPRGCR